MPLRWDTYCQARQRRNLEPLAAEERQAIEQMVSTLLGLSPADEAGEWGEAIGYGLYAAAVVRIRPDVAHPFRGVCPSVAVKVLNTAMDKFVRFQKDIFSTIRLGKVQQTLDAGVRPDGRGKRRGYLVLQYVEGEPLDEVLLQSRPISAVRARDLLTSFFAEILIPLWADGLRFWDFRPANLVVTPGADHLVLIDTDSLRQGLEERTQRPDEWTVRDQQEQQAFKGNLARLTASILAAQGHTPVQARAAVGEALERSELPAALRRLGRKGATGARDEAQAALGCFVQRLGKKGLL